MRVRNSTIKRFICNIVALCLTFQSAVAEPVVVERHREVQHNKDYKVKNDASIIPADSNIGIDHSANNTQVVNINAPNDAGISHNQFQDFNVSHSGLIINNSNQIGNSEIGGVVLANPNMVGGSQASTIINEVISNRSSSIMGTTEIFGGRADYILANSNGITVSNGQYINVGGVTLTTGSIGLNSRGELEKILVDKGHISFLKDLKLENLDYFDIISRTAYLGAKIHAGGSAQLITGRNEYFTKTGAVKPLPDDGLKQPELSIDASNLGGLYAGKIQIQSTEKGVGVNLGELGSLSFEVSVNSNGDITHKNIFPKTDLDVKSTGNIEISRDAKVSGGEKIRYVADGDINIENVDFESKNDIFFRSKNFTNKGIIKSINGNITFLQGNQFSNIGTMFAQNKFVAAVAGSFLNRGEVRAITKDLALSTNGELINTGILYSSKGKIHAITKSDFFNHGIVSSQNEIQITSEGITHNGASGYINSRTNSIIFDSADRLENSGKIHAPESIAQKSKNSISNIGNINSKDVNLKSENSSIENYGIITGVNLDLESGERFINEGNILSKNNIKIHSGSDFINHGEIAHLLGNKIDHPGNIDLSANGDFVNSNGIILSNSILKVSANKEFKNDKGIISSIKDLILDSGEGAINSGDISSQSRVIFASDMDLKNTGLIRSQEAMEISASSLMNSGRIDASKNIDLDIENTIINENSGLIFSKDITNINSGGNLINLGSESQIVSNKNLTLNVSGDFFNEGKLLTNNKLNAKVLGNTTNSGILQSQNRLHLKTTNNFDNQGIIYSPNHIYIKTDRDFDNRISGSIESKKILNILVGNNADNSGKLLSGGEKIDIDAGDRIINQGVIGSEESKRDETSPNSLPVSSANVLDPQNESGIILKVKNKATNSGTITSKQSKEVILEGLAIENNKGSIIASDKIILTSKDQEGISQDIKNLSGRILSKGSVQIESKQGSFVNGSAEGILGVILAGSGLAISSKLDLKNSGRLDASTTLNLTSQNASVINQGDINSISDIDVSANENFINSKNIFSSEGKVKINSKNMSKNGKEAQISAYGQISFDDAKSFYNEGVLNSDNAGIDVKASKIIDLNNSSRIKSSGTVALKTENGKINPAGIIESGGLVIMKTSEDLQNYAFIKSNNGFDLSSKSFENNALITVSENENAKITTEGFITNNKEGVISVANGSLSLISSKDDLINKGQIDVTNGKIIVQAKKLSNFSNARIDSDNGGVLTIDAILDNKGYITFYNGKMHIQSPKILNDGNITGKEIDIQDAAIENKKTIFTTDNMKIRGASLTNDGRVQSAGVIDASFTGDIRNNKLIYAKDSLTLSGYNISNNHAINSNNIILTTGGAFDNNSIMEAGKNLRIDSSGKLANNGQILSFGNASINADSLYNSNKLGATGFLEMDVKTDVINRKLIEAGDIRFKLDGNFTNDNSTILSAGSIDVRGSKNTKAGTISNRAGNIRAESGDLFVDAKNFEQPANISFFKYSKSSIEAESENYKYDLGKATKQRVSRLNTHEAEYYGDIFTFSYVYKDYIKDISEKATLYSANNLILNVDSLDSRGSNIFAVKDSRYPITKQDFLYGYKLNVIKREDYHIRTDDKRFGERMHEAWYEKREVSVTGSDAIKENTNAQNITITGTEISKQSYNPSSALSEPENPSRDSRRSSISETATEINVEFDPDQDDITKSPQIEARVSDAKLQEFAGELKEAFPEIQYPYQEEDYSKYSLPDPILEKSINDQKWRKPKAPDNYYIKEVSDIFTDHKKYFSTGDFIKRIPNYEPYKENTSQPEFMHLGDPYKQHLFIKKQMIDLTGLENLGDEDSDQQIKNLYANAEHIREDLSLKPGIALSKAQADELQDDMIWPEEIQIDDVRVVVPRLYIAKKNRKAKFESGIRAKESIYIEDQDINLGGRTEAPIVIVKGNKITNNSNVRGDHVFFQSKNDMENKKSIHANNALLMRTGGSLINNQGTMYAEKLLSAYVGGDFDNIDGAKFKSGTDAAIVTEGDLNNVGSEMASVRDMSLDVGGTLTNLTEKNRYGIEGKKTTHNVRHKIFGTQTIEKEGASDYYDVLQERAKINVGGHLEAKSGRDMRFIGSNLKAGSASLESAGNIGFESQKLDAKKYYSYSSKKYSARHNEYHVKHAASNIDIAGDLSTKSDGDMTILGSEVRVGGDANIETDGNFTVASQVNIDHIEHDSSSKKKGMFKNSSKKSSNMNHNESLHEAKLQVAGQINAKSKEDQIFYGADISSGKETKLQGQNIELLAAEVSDSQSSFSSKRGVMWQSAKGNSKSDSKIHETSISAPQIDIDTNGFIQAEIASDDSPLKSQIKNIPVEYTKLSETHSSDSFKSQGLTPEGSFIVGAGAAIATYGAIWGFSSGASAAGVGATKVTTAQAMQTAALKAGAMSLASTGAISLTNNRGDIGKTLGEVVSADTLISVAKSASVGAITAGIMSSTGAEKMLTPDSGEFYKGLAVQSGVGSSVAGIVYGSSLDRILGDAASSFVLGSVQHKVGDAGISLGLEEGSAGKMAMHGLVGGAVESMRGGKFEHGFASSAIGEKVGSLIADRGASSEIVRSGAGLSSGITSILAGGDGEVASRTQSVAESADSYNREFHKEEREFLAELEERLTPEEFEQYKAIAFNEVKGYRSIRKDDPRYPESQKLRGIADSASSEKLATMKRLAKDLGYGDGLFKYGTLDRWSDSFAKRDEGLTQTGAGVRIVGGVVTFAAGGGIAVGEGAKTLFYDEYKPTEGERIFDSFTKSVDSYGDIAALGTGQTLLDVSGALGKGIKGTQAAYRMLKAGNFAYKFGSNMQPQAAGGPNVGKGDSSLMNAQHKSSDVKIVGMNTTPKTGGNNTGRVEGKISKVPVTKTEEAVEIQKLQTGTRKDGKKYHPKYVQNQTSGIKGEVHPRRTLERAGYQMHKTADKTIDTVAIKRDSKGQIADVIIVESKYRAKGTPKLKKQMTDDWIDSNIKKMRGSADPEVRATGNMLDANRHLIRRKTNLMKPNGSNKWGMPKLPPTSKFKE